jgi:hypothetical protein
MRFSRDNIRSRPSLRAQQRNPEPQKQVKLFSLLFTMAANPARYFLTALAIARQI